MNTRIIIIAVALIFLLIWIINYPNVNCKCENFMEHLTPASGKSSGSGRSVPSSVAGRAQPPTLSQPASKPVAPASKTSVQDKIDAQIAATQSDKTLTPEERAAQNAPSAVLQQLANIRDQDLAQFLATHPSGDEDTAPLVDDSTNNRIPPPTYDVAFNNVNQCMTTCSKNNDCIGFLINNQYLDSGYNPKDSVSSVEHNGKKLCTMVLNPSDIGNVDESLLINPTNTYFRRGTDDIHLHTYQVTTDVDHCNAFCPKCAIGKCPLSYRCTDLQTDSSGKNCFITNEIRYDEVNNILFDDASIQPMSSQPVPVAMPVPARPAPASLMPVSGNGQPVTMAPSQTDIQQQPQQSSQQQHPRQPQQLVTRTTRPAAQPAAQPSKPPSTAAQSPRQPPQPRSRQPKKVEKFGMVPCGLSSDEKYLRYTELSRSLGSSIYP